MAQARRRQAAVQPVLHVAPQPWRTAAHAGASRTTGTLAHPQAGKQHCTSRGRRRQRQQGSKGQATLQLARAQEEGAPTAAGGAQHEQASHYRQSWWQQWQQ